MQKNNGKNGWLIIILLVIVSVLILFFPKLYDYINSFSMPKIEETKQEIEQNEDKEVSENILETIHYPIMRTSIYDSKTYYSLDKFTIEDLSNNDILLTAFLDIYEGNMTAYEEVGACTTISKQFNKEYLELRIKNIVNNKIKYTLSSFYVPEDSNSNYVGTWNYDSIYGRYVYIGLCASKETNVKYYDLEELIKVEYDGKDIVSYYYVGFAKVDGNNYMIYKDADMTSKIAEGVFVNKEELENVFKNINKKDKNIYKYTFKNTLCSYNEYCLFEGKWVNEI